MSGIKADPLEDEAPRFIVRQSCTPEPQHTELAELDQRETSKLLAQLLEKVDQATQSMEEAKSALVKVTKEIVILKRKLSDITESSDTSSVGLVEEQVVDEIREELSSEDEPLIRHSSTRERGEASSIEEDVGEKSTEKHCSSVSTEVEQSVQGEIKVGAEGVTPTVPCTSPNNRSRILNCLVQPILRAILPFSHVPCLVQSSPPSPELWNKFGAFVESLQSLQRSNFGKAVRRAKVISLSRRKDPDFMSRCADSNNSYIREAQHYLNLVLVASNSEAPIRFGDVERPWLQQTHNDVPSSNNQFSELSRLDALQKWRTLVSRAPRVTFPLIDALYLESRNQAEVPFLALRQQLHSRGLALDLPANSAYGINLSYYVACAMIYCNIEAVIPANNNILHLRFTKPTEPFKNDSHNILYYSQSSLEKVENAASHVVTRSKREKNLFKRVSLPEITDLRYLMKENDYYSSISRLYSEQTDCLELPESLTKNQTTQNQARYSTNRNSPGDAPIAKSRKRPRQHRT